MVDETNDKSDRRSTERHSTERFVTISELDNSESWQVEALVMDFSSTGISLQTYQSISVGTKIKMVMSGEFTATGEVVNQEEQESNSKKQIRLGVKFIDKSSDWPLR